MLESLSLSPSGTLRALGISSAGGDSGSSRSFAPRSLAAYRPPALVYSAFTSTLYGITFLTTLLGFELPAAL